MLIHCWELIKYCKGVTEKITDAECGVEKKKVTDILKKFELMDEQSNISHDMKKMVDALFKDDKNNSLLIEYKPVDPINNTECIPLTPSDYHNLDQLEIGKTISGFFNGLKKFFGFKD